MIIEKNFMQTTYALFNQFKQTMTYSTLVWKISPIYPYSSLHIFPGSYSLFAKYDRCVERWKRRHETRLNTKGYVFVDFGYMSAHIKINILAMSFECQKLFGNEMCEITANPFAHCIRSYAMIQIKST